MCTFRVTDHEHSHKPDHCTISNKGVTRMREDDETEFIPLDRWEQEYTYFRRLVKVCLMTHFSTFRRDVLFCIICIELIVYCFQIKVFAQFRMWKAFYVWKKNVHGKKFTDNKKQLNENLFIVNPVHTTSCFLCQHVSPLL